jgi:hypothetical protein
MPDYQKMYHALFNEVSDIIRQLQQIQLNTEEMYVESKEPDITLLHYDAAEDM